MPKIDLRNIHLIAVPLATCLILSALLMGKAAALQLQNRSIELSTSQPSVVASHTFRFTFASTTSVGSIVFEYCDDPLFEVACVAPAGLNVASATLTGQTGNTGFSFDSLNSNANKIVITRAPAAAAAVPSSYNFGNITNPSSPGAATYVRISTLASVDGSGVSTDRGAVAFATLSVFTIAVDVPPFLQVCVAITVAPDCSSMSGNSIDMGTLSSLLTRVGTSQFAVATNSVTGYIIFIQGTTLTSGNNAITALSVQTPSFPGNNQFGVNLRDNSIPDVGTDPSGSGTGTVAGNYNTPNQYRFINGETIVTSPLPSDYNLMTVSYIVNISNSQPPGVYSSTYTYLATAEF